MKYIRPDLGKYLAPSRHCRVGNTVHILHTAHRFTSFINFDICSCGSDQCGAAPGVRSNDKVHTFRRTPLDSYEVATSHLLLSRLWSRRCKRSIHSAATPMLHAVIPKTLRFALHAARPTFVPRYTTNNFLDRTTRLVVQAKRGSEAMPKGIKKENLPSKICLTCKRPFTWRKV